MDILGMLPVEVARLVLELLPARDLGSCSRVSKTWRSLVDCPLLWKRRCLDSGWTDTSFVTQQRSHRPRNAYKDEAPLWFLNDWALNFKVHYKLPISWEKEESINFLLSPRASEVTVFSCDERTMVMGHADGSVSVLDVYRVPQLRTTLDCLLPGHAVLALQVTGRHLVVLQSKLLQIYLQRDDGDYVLVDAKSFELGYTMIETLQKYQGDNFGMWYSEQLNCERYTKEKLANLISFQIADGIVYVGVRDYQMIYGWSAYNGIRQKTIHIPNRTCKLRDVTVYDGCIYMIFASRNVRHITAYDIDGERFIYELTTPECKTQKLIVGQYLIGVAISGPGLTSPGLIKVWDKTNGKELATRQTGLVSFKTVTEIYDLIAYAEGTTVNIWDPKNDMVLKTLSFGKVIYLMPCPFRFLLIIGNGFSWMWDWMASSKLYRLFPQIVKSGDYRGLVFADTTMLMFKIDSSVIEMIAFC